MSKKRFTVGQEVVLVRRGGYDKGEPTFEQAFVSKVGTKWVEAHRGDARYAQRYNGKTGKGTTYRDSDINRIYESREAFEKAESEKAERKNFYRLVSSYSFHNDLELVPIEDVRAAAKLLGIKLEKGE